jgi:uncharacterized membrane protein YdbT with pleckstrin-like domain
VIHQTTVHWIVYGRAVFWLIVAIAFYVASQRAGETNYAGPLRVVAAGLTLIAALDGLGALLRRASTELAITDRRIISKAGIVRRRTFEMNRSKIESVLVDQSVLGRLFDFGTIVVKGTGGGVEPFVEISEPIKFRSFVTAG